MAKSAEYIPLERPLSSATTVAPVDAGPSSFKDTENLTKYNLYYTTSMLDATMHLGDKSSPTEYFMQSKLTGAGRLLLHRGSSKKDPIVSFAKFRLTSRHMIIGTGDCEDKKNPEGVSFEELKRDKNVLRRSGYHFRGEDAVTGQHVEVAWKKNMENYLGSQFEAVDQNGRVLGKVLSGGCFNWSKGAEIYVADESRIGLELKELLIVTALAIWAFEGISGWSMTRGYEKGDKKAE